VGSAHVGYGEDRVEIALPGGVDVRVLEPASPTAVREPLAVVARAVDEPVDALPLEEAARPARSIALVVPDGTRPAGASTYLLPVLARLARAGRTPDQMRLVIARGVHPATPRPQVEAMLGRELMSVLRPVQSAPNTPEMNVTVGTDPEIGEVRVHRHVAQADLVVLTGGVLPHHLAGFGGGPKALVPGVADKRTVLAAHRLTLDALVRPDGSIRSAAGHPEENGFHAALLRVARAFGKVWLLNVVLTPDGTIGAACGGEVGAAHAGAVAAWRALYDPPAPAPHDLVVAGTTGPPSRDLIQCHKSLLRALDWARPGAPIVWAAPAGSGPGHPSLLPWFTSGPLPRHLAALRRDFHPYGLTAYSIRRIAKDHPVYVVSEMSRDLLRPMGLLPCKSLQAAVDLACREHEVASAAVLVR
jgi:nickel-dependent lactate racemase